MKDRLQVLLEGIEADCALITNDTNRRYLTGMKSSAGIVLVFPECAYLLIDFRYIEKARSTVKHCEVIEIETIYAQIDSLLKQHNAKSIAVEARSMTLQGFTTWQEKLPGYRFLTDDSLSERLYALRTVKTCEEIQKIRAAQDIAETALAKVLPQIHIGITEREVALLLDTTMRQLGAEDLSFETIALFGENTSMPHGVPSDRTLGSGEFVLMDFGAVVDGYHSDMTRTVCMGKPSKEMEQVYAIVLQAQQEAIAYARAGIMGRELDKVARDYITEKGYGKAFGHSLGHGVGLEIHEYPNAAQSQKTILAVGNIITIEPGIYLPNRFGVRIEDFVQITENGCENLTKFPKNLQILD